MNLQNEVCLEAIELENAEMVNWLALGLEVGNQIGKYDACKVGGFAQRFIWMQNLARTQPNEFYFEYKLKNEHKY
jgi:hypothetical protein